VPPTPYATIYVVAGESVEGLNLFVAADPDVPAVLFDLTGLTALSELDIAELLRVVKRGQRVYLRLVHESQPWRTLSQKQCLVNGLEPNVFQFMKNSTKE
jgi:hypothetical protein